MTYARPINNRVIPHRDGLTFSVYIDRVIVLKLDKLARQHCRSRSGEIAAACLKWLGKEKP